MQVVRILKVASHLQRESPDDQVSITGLHVSPNVILLQSNVEIWPLNLQPLTLFRPWSLPPQYFPD